MAACPQRAIRAVANCDPSSTALAKRIHRPPYFEEMQLRSLLSAQSEADAQRPKRKDLKQPLGQPVVRLSAFSQLYRRDRRQQRRAFLELLNLSLQIADERSEPRLSPPLLGKRS